MSIDRRMYEHVRAIFDELVDLPLPVRERRLAEVGREHPAVREEVERWLRADPEAEDALVDYRFVAAASGEQRAVENPQVTRDPLGVLGRLVHHFVVTDYIAAGGMGVVYRANDTRLDRVVALKFPAVHPDLDLAARDRFLHEARSAATLDHENLCSVLDVGECEYGVYLAMPFYVGETLKQRLARTGPLPMSQALAIARQLARGMGAAHDAGVVHRDLKPANVMLVADDRVKVLDFGLAKMRDVSLTKSNVTLGTIGYIAPEQVRGLPVDARADLWAIGVMLYEMLTGVAPFAGEHDMTKLHAVLHRDPVPASQLRPDVPKVADALLESLLQKDPAHRTASARALLDDIERVELGRPPVSSPPFWHRTPARRRARRAALPAAALLLTVSVTAATASRIRDARGAVRDRKAQDVQWVGDTAYVTNDAELAALLHPRYIGRVLRLGAGVYDIDRPHVVPDGMTIEGAGRMLYGADSLPTGFSDESRTTIRMVTSTEGDLLALGNGAMLRRVEIVDASGRSGNVIRATSRRPADSVRVRIDEVVVSNPNPALVSPAGPTGRALLVASLNPMLGAPPAPHDRSVVNVQMTRSMIRSPAGGGGFFVYNFAPNSTVSAELARNVIGGTNEANGGVSRTDAVHDSEARIRSQANLYRNEWADPCASSLTGWNLTGGSGAPIAMKLPATERNRLSVESRGDRFVGFTLTVLATGARSFYPASLNEPPADNRIDLTFSDTRITSATCKPVAGSVPTAGVPLAQHDSIADFRLSGAWVRTAGISPGLRNVVHVELRAVTGSGVRANRFEAVGGPSEGRRATSTNTGNRLEIVGSADQFARENPAVSPAPAAAFFVPREPRQVERQRP